MMLIFFWNQREVRLRQKRYKVYFDRNPLNNNEIEAGSKRGVEMVLI
jgi:hypothetical protein